MKKKIRKGDYGYIKREKIVRFEKTLLAFVLPIGFFIAGLIINKGDNKSIYTIIAMIGCIPACLVLVNMVMMWMRKPMDEALYQEILPHTGNLEMAYELYLTTYDKNLFLDAAAFCGDHLAAYTHEKVSRGDLVFMENHLKKVFRAEHYKVNVKIFDQKKNFLERLDIMAEKQAEYEQQAAEDFRPYPTYPDLTKSEVIKHLTMAVSL